MEFDTTTLKAIHLKRIRALADLDQSQLARFLPYVDFVQYDPNATIFREGDKADYMLLILHGKVRTLASKKKGRPYFLRYQEPGESLGEIALIDGGRRSATVEACDDCLMLKIDRDALKKLITEEPTLANQFLMRLCIELGGRLRDLTKRVGNDAALSEVLQACV